MADPTTATRPGTDLPDGYRPWPALWAMVIGFFMILVDSTIVSIATPAIMRGLDAGVDSVLWVTSAYLLAYAVPLLITGRLGDRVGPKNLYLAGLAVFTLASLWCGLTGSITELVIARVVQGLGASMMTPQTMTVITRTFPAASRGQAMSLWGATAGVATLVGPLLGGVLVDGPGWEWIFFINVPVGLIAFALAWRLVPTLQTHSHSFDLVGVALSAVGMFLLVFGIQEGETYDWGTITGFITVKRLIAAGIIVMVVFVWWQSRIKREPLVPLGIFRDRNFSLSNLAITTVGFAITAFAFPFTLFAQLVLGLSPTRAALLTVPTAVVSVIVAPFVGRLVDRMHPRVITTFGFVVGVLAFWWLSRSMTAGAPAWHLLGPMALVGLGTSTMFAPLAATATRNLPLASAGAGSGIYNTTRQVGAVLGSAAIAAVIEARLRANLGDAAAGSGGMAGTAGVKLPPQVADGFATAMSQAMLLPAGVLVIGLVVVVFLAKPSHR
ncbi:DHA2 family efflux MFS transporter permease subunit [Knoellia koreensis]|uniref:DHA2 family efflux MFS transporter permease subunit n=1 Tax=Knoellia koreensis TaxID=2730921 RepID=A0A849HC03_9MICO|nr:DHA2 family efflux MFS transporter permease subunit [Knoellia sp. DB2414S]NNM47266.1 DHA2 family efflux MFS transporter permease subunit [Knoellia sp. DB2414S]